jgi:hypothetical protein
MKYSQTAWRSFAACVLFAAAGCGPGQLSSRQAMEAIQKTSPFLKPQQGGFKLRVLEIVEVRSLNKTTSSVQFRWAAESPDVPECRLEITSQLQFQSFESGWQFEEGQLVSTLQAAMQSAVNPRAAEKTMRLISMTEGDFASRRGRYAGLTELMDANILPRSLASSDEGFESSGYFFKFSSSKDKFCLTSRSLIITDEVPSYYADNTGGLRISTKGSATAESPLLP